MVLSRTDRLRPFPMGVSIGHCNITAGTAGCVVVDPQGNEYILSNNHVLADSNKGKTGDAILQPGVYDGGTIDDAVASLYNYVPIEFPENSGCLIAKEIVSFLNFVSRALGRKSRFYSKVDEYPVNETDCAIAKPTNPQIYTCEVMELGFPKGSAKAKDGETVLKSGRTTGLTEGKVIDDDATIEVSYGFLTARFIHQILVSGEGFILGGDSGSVLFNEDLYAVGLCFAGSSDGSLGIANPIYVVEQLLGVAVKT